MFQFLLRLMQHTKWICSKYIFKNKKQVKKQTQKQGGCEASKKKAQNECEQVKKSTKNF